MRKIICVLILIWKNLTEHFQKSTSIRQKVLGTNVPVKWYEIPKEEAVKIPAVVKMAKALPPNLLFFRIVEIVGLDKQADGGTHVRNLREVGKIRLIRIENKGKNNRRVYFRLS